MESTENFSYLSAKGPEFCQEYQGIKGNPSLPASNSKLFGKGWVCSYYLIGSWDASHFYEAIPFPSTRASE